MMEKSQGLLKSREIKFRFYSVAGMQDVVSINFEDQTVELTDGDIRTIEYNHLIQYTGLKDRIGVEIYEGDIIESVVLLGEGDSIRSVVIYSQGSFLANGLLSMNAGGVVIGNIFENPELLDN